MLKILNSEEYSNTVYLVHVLVLVSTQAPPLAMQLRKLLLLVPNTVQAQNSVESA